MQRRLAPLRALEEKFRATKILQWSEEAKEQFENIKLAINNHQKIFFYDNNHGTVYVITDASDYGIGAYVLQKDVESGREYPIGYMSEVLSKIERRWTTIEKECYAIVRAFEKIEYLLRDVQFILLTDHKNLVYMNEPR
jgi:hypothetical protein